MTGEIALLLDRSLNVRLPVSPESPFC